MGYLGLITKPYFCQSQTNKLPIKKEPTNKERDPIEEANGL